MINKITISAGDDTPRWLPSSTTVIIFAKMKIFSLMNTLQTSLFCVVRRKIQIIVAFFYDKESHPFKLFLNGSIGGLQCLTLLTSHHSIYFSQLLSHHIFPRMDILLYDHTIRFHCFTIYAFSFVYDVHSLPLNMSHMII